MNIYNLTLEQLETYFINKGDKKFRAKQIYEWLYQKRVKSFEEMDNIKKELRDELTNEFTFGKIEIVSKLTDTDVYKYLFKLEDNQMVEAVIMHHDYGYSICLSTQVGCNMGCTFCESGRRKKVRNLECYEMILPILLTEEDLKIKITRVVLMGIGEPFDNYDNVINFINIINNPFGLAIGSRHITVSTCGIVPKIYEFIKDGKQVNLAISLHAPNNELRSQIMNINKAYKIEEVIKAVKEYINKTNRRVTFEYILLDNVNDKEENAKELCELLKGMNAYVNLIPYNATSHIEYKRSNNEKIKKFHEYLLKNGICATIRREFGSKVKAACGQLRSDFEEGKNE